MENYRNYIWLEQSKNKNYQFEALGVTGLLKTPLEIRNAADQVDSVIHITFILPIGKSIFK